MSEIPKPEEMPQDFYELCISITAKRAKTVIDHIMKNGYITTEELKDQYGYDHPPRAARDVRENGIPLVTDKVLSSSTGRTIGAYKFDYRKRVKGRIGGRKAFSVKFKRALIDRYGSKSALTNEQIDARYLQIDHRIPYEVAGNDAGEDVEHYMLLDASGQRAKSWSCENCSNFRTSKDKKVCESCFWAYPEAYTHIATRPERRLDVVWSGSECVVYERFLKMAASHRCTPQELVKNAIRRIVTQSGE
ncbi:hypothetical protein [Thalassospira sp. MBR-102]|uniref:hypothetical protein n=1 Tax=Thalassospira sp. MBR-102 TaxID=3156466 RepID=UPI0033927E3D